MNLMKFYFLLITILVTSCSYGPDVLIKKEFDGDRVAVMNFQTEGTYLANNVGKAIADKLTEILFLNGEYKVIDRSAVKNTITQLGIQSVELLSTEDIMNIGQKLQANYLILGRIEQISNQEFISRKDDMQMNISFRIISTTDAEVIGMASYSVFYNENIIARLDDALEDIVSRM